MKPAFLNGAVGKRYTRLGELKTGFPDVPVIALTATADSKTRIGYCRTVADDETQNLRFFF